MATLHLQLPDELLAAKSRAQLKSLAQEALLVKLFQHGEISAPTAGVGACRGVAEAAEMRPHPPLELGRELLYQLGQGLFSCGDTAASGVLVMLI